MRIPAVALAFVLAASLGSCQSAFTMNNRLHTTITGRIRTSLLSQASQSSDDKETTNTEIVGRKQVTQEKLFIDPIELNESEFINNGPLAWMNTYLDLFGVREGKSMFYGPIPIDVDDSKRVSEEEAAALRKNAAKNLENIGNDERQRRTFAGNIFAAVTAAYVVWAALVADNGAIEGHLLRFLSILPLFFTVGYKLSAETGL
jgi:hypothetical protein